MKMLRKKKSKEKENNIWFTIYKTNVPIWCHHHHFHHFYQKQKECDVDDAAFNCC